MRAGGLESNRQGFAFYRAVDDAGGFQVFSKEVGPGLHLLGMHQNDGAGDVPNFGKVFFGSLRHINHWDVSVRGQRGSPGNGNCPQHELLRRNDCHACCAFRPRCLD
jgi:hypothetical protein